MKPQIFNLEFVNKQSSKNLFNVISTFAGGGGSSTGYRLAGGHILAVNEFVPEARRVYGINYPDTYIFPHDIRHLTGKYILDRVGLKPGELDLFDGSPPCSSFSMSGLREEGWGREKKYSDKSQRTDDLFYEYARVMNEIQPKVFIAENVKGLTMGAASDLLGDGQHDLFGAEENTFYNTLEKCGYNVKYKVLNAANYGVPQSRERLIFIGVRKDFNIIPTFPKPIPGFVSANEAIEDLPEPKEKDVKKLGEKGIELWHATELGSSFSRACETLYGKGSWFNFVRTHPEQPAPTLITSQGMQHWSRPTTFSIKELIRFCSFPDDYYLGENYIKQYERLARAVPPLLMKAVAEHVYNTILSKIKKHDTEVVI